MRTRARPARAFILRCCNPPRHHATHPHALFTLTRTPLSAGCNDAYRLRPLPPRHVVHRRCPGVLPMPVGDGVGWHGRVQPAGLLRCVGPPTTASPVVRHSQRHPSPLPPPLSQACAPQASTRTRAPPSAGRTNAPRATTRRGATATTAPRRPSTVQRAPRVFTSRLWARCPSARVAWRLPTRSSLNPGLLATRRAQLAT